MVFLGRFGGEPGTGRIKLGGRGLGQGSELGGTDRLTDCTQISPKPPAPPNGELPVKTQREEEPEALSGLRQHREGVAHTGGIWHQFPVGGIPEAAGPSFLYKKSKFGCYKSVSPCTTGVPGGTKENGV